ncbi:hypothetical protein LQ327_17945 [Actinomycetospora endophytica]|uniref:Peptidase M4 family protein n=1 Tax=Actinomycetospora endophytica TaxID=2291215 RepID=A0ABS8PAH5_9PSEU|nr:hypothetical protein [Actinomycetospora endophytica]MCD2195254.1 hypothetical protein [Actinomycetospora endophytica]
MSLELDARLAETGTRFKLFAQPRFLTRDNGRPVFKAEEVVVSTPPADMSPGPADHRMYVVDAVNKRPYAAGELPPYRGEAGPPVRPGSDGHFDQIDEDSRAFSAATMFATVRRVLDIWEDYFSHRVDWAFDAQFSRLEMIPLIEWNNAHSGWGFLEFGFGSTESGTIDHSRPYCENFDVLAHELGHSIIFSQVGIPRDQSDPAIDCGGFQESSADVTAIVALLHFDTFVNELLAQTKGNLLTVNGLDRVGELSNSRQVRVALNAKRMTDVGDEPHDRSLPLTGAIFDTMTEIFQQDLVDTKLISEDLRDRSTNTPNGAGDLAEIEADFTAAYQGHEAEFKQALLKARDQMGRLLAETWSHLSPERLTYFEVFAGLLRADRSLNGGEFQSIIRDAFSWRGIQPDSDLRRQLDRTLVECGLRPATTVGHTT